MGLETEVKEALNLYFIKSVIMGLETEQKIKKVQGLLHPHT